MTKARFYIKDKPLQGLRGRGAEPHKVQEVGYKVHIMQKILNSDLIAKRFDQTFSKFDVINSADGRVEVRLEGEREGIKLFSKKFYDLEFKADLMVQDSMRSSQALKIVGGELAWA